MKIIDGLSLKGRPFEIPDASRDDLPDFFKEMGYKVGAEIGVYKGEFTQQFCKAGFNMFAIDPWLFYADYQHPHQEIFDTIYEYTTKVLSPYPNCQIIRKTSMEAVENFEDDR